MVAFYPTLPTTKGIQSKRAWLIGNYAALLFCDVPALNGNRMYPFVLEVWGPFPESARVTLYVTSETGSPTNFLCVFYEGGRRNYGESDDWKSEDKFVARALEVVREMLAIEDNPLESVPPPPRNEVKSQSLDIRNLLCFIPVLVAFVYAPFNSVNSKGVAWLEGWGVIFTAGDSGGVQVNYAIWGVQLLIASAISYYLYRLWRT